MAGVDSRRIHYLNSEKDSGGPVIYWMSREQRVQDNWGLLHARHVAGNSRPLVVVFCLAPSFIGATARQYDFMLKGLAEVEFSLVQLGIPFVLKMGSPEFEIPDLAKELDAGLIISDFDPLRIKKIWQETVTCNINIPFIEVDGHNVVPARFVSDKREYGARTIRTKIGKLLHEFLEEFPALQSQNQNKISSSPIDWAEVRNFIEVDESVMAVDLSPGESSGQVALTDFIENRLSRYAESRNDPNLNATSRLSAYFHFGQLAPQRAALAVSCTGSGVNQEAYLEELIVRRELSDNFCLYTPKYDSLDAAPQWAINTLEEYSEDVRDYLYSYEEFEKAVTHSALWNAAQTQLVVSGSMHGYMRMYWAKKILEWSASPSEALKIVIALNDRYALDGRDPNGYVGALWSVAGLHDRAWKKRPVFGSIRYMNERGCRRKFDVDAYIKKWIQPSSYH
ncbi:deoxyribodipyrimidine photo-lyase [Maridesulfovibrio zosterae]|uniref:deoxyribodipyrimidine photo-lyase n=1 Tax=Maridesulfovibrio zosterae TaxID=82171 RepID=UPI0003F4EC26|nr:deoxyribodipyrimidine photo-lyase [Maridesulfovibrio zosterae]